MSEEVNQPEGQQSLPPAKDFPQEASSSNTTAEPQAGSQQPGGSRRRRRRRKSGGRPQPGEPQAQNASGEQPASPASNDTQNRPQQGQGQSQGQGQRRNGRRRNNKRPFGTNQQSNNGRFAQSGQGQRQNNGSNNNNNGRRRRGRRQVVFVGPMDHSYRAQSPGNVADDSSSNQNGRYRSDSSHDNGNGSALPEHAHAGEHHIREDAPTRIFCFVEDLFFLAKIQEVARKVGVKVAFLKNDKESLAKLFEQEEKPVLIIVDLNNVNAKPLQLIPKLRTKFKKGTSILGFVSHIQGDLKVKAQEEGCDVVMPRSAFSQNLPNIFHRHADDEDDGGMQPPGI